MSWSELGDFVSWRWSKTDRQNRAVLMFFCLLALWLPVYQAPFYAAFFAMKKDKQQYSYFQVGLLKGPRRRKLKPSFMDDP